MSFRDRIRAGIDWTGALWTVCGWFGLASVISGGVVAIGGGAWAAVTGVSRPIVIMAAFCTITATIYLAMAPMAWRALRRIQDVPPAAAKPDPEIWKLLSEYQLYEAACLLADMQQTASPWPSWNDRREPLGRR